MVGDATSGSRATLVRLFTARPTSVLDDLASRSDAAMRVLFDGAASGLLLIDRGGRIVRINAALRSMLAADIDLAVGVAAARIFAPDERTAAWTKIQALLSGRSPSCRLIARLPLTGSGEDRRADIGGRLIREPNGTISGVLLRITDISAQARLEAELAQSRELEAVGHLVGGVAHDFNNLLTTILGAVELVRELGPDASILSELEHIRRSAERGAALVRNLLALGRQQYLRATPIDVNAALLDFAAMIRPALGAGVALDLALEQPGRRIRVDPVQFDQVLTNLAMNANHAMPGGGRLTLRSGRATLYRKQVQGQETIPPGRYVIVSVQDSGTGIPPELLDRIFEPFFTTRRAQGGSGLGLATAHGIVRQSGGFLTVESEVGKGTTFRIHLPREEAMPTQADSQAAAPAAADVVAPALAMPRRLLLVDDEYAVRRITARALTRHGWEVLEAESAEAALALLDADRNTALTAVVSDVVMPGLDGAGLVEAVRERYPGLPAILVSGYAESMLGDRGLVAIAFVGKPYTPKALLARLDEIVPDPWSQTPA